MKLTFRVKLALLLGCSIVTLAAVETGSLVMSVRQGQGVEEVERHLVPKLELGPQVQVQLDGLRQALQDAVAARDASAIDATLPLKNELLLLIAMSGDVLEEGDAARLHRAIEDYYAAASSVSRRLIAEETGDALVRDISEMQTLQRRAAQLVRETTVLDKTELSGAFASIRETSDNATTLRFLIGVLGILLLATLSVSTSRSLFRTLRPVSVGFSRFATGDFSQEIPVVIDDDIGRVAKDANAMAHSLRRAAEQRDRADWLRAGRVGLSDALRGAQEPREVARTALWDLARRVGACAGVFYLSEPQGGLVEAARYALSKDEATDASEEPASRRLREGEGLVGQAALGKEVLVVNDPPPGYLTVSSGLGQTAPRAIALIPLVGNERTVGVLELALLTPWSSDAAELVESVREMLVGVILSAQSRASLRELLERTQRQAERLAAQEEELRLNNRELQAQQEDLQRANAELDAQARALDLRNTELEQARAGLQQKAEDLAKASSYKSEFLANMSHELRTPLNSMLLLSHLLAENEAGNLTPKQVEHARTVLSAGKELLALINQVLDLAKIESGKQEVHVDSVDLEQMAAYVRRVFAPLAEDKGLRLVVEIEPGLPATLATDQQRLEGILTNLVGNAVKFTEQGEIRIQIRRPGAEVSFQRPELSHDACVAFAVSDTGVGIRSEEHERVFAPFEQLDSRADRRYGGTGLGLSIARQSVHLLGGELHLASEHGVGSTFTCYLPVARGALREQAPAGKVAALVSRVGRSAPLGDRDSLGPSEPHMLIIEDDAVLAEQLVEIIHRRGFKVLVTGSGEEGLRLAKDRLPQGIILDVMLPDIDGFTIMERLRGDPETRSIPVHFLSGVGSPERGLALGAVGYLVKPATRAQLFEVVQTLALPSRDGPPHILVVEDDVVAGESLLALLEGERCIAKHVRSAAAAVAAIERERFGCMVLDLGLPDMDGLVLLEKLRSRSGLALPRVVVHTGRALTKEESRRLNDYTEAVVLKDGNSATRLIEEVRLLLGHVKQTRSLLEAREVQAAVAADVSLAGVRLVLADDDMRTVYALSALLRSKGADVFVADTGKEALEVLDQHPNVDVVLMDIMMPEMDGYEAMRRLRKQKRFERLPVIALTAKAMKGERERCLDAGANEYLSKPIDGERLLLAIRALLRPSDRAAQR